MTSSGFGEQLELIAFDAANALPTFAELEKDSATGLFSSARDMQALGSFNRGR